MTLYWVIWDLKGSARHNLYGDKNLCGIQTLWIHKRRRAIEGLSPGLDYRGWVGKILIAEWNFPYSLKYPIKAMTDNIAFHCVYGFNV